MTVQYEPRQPTTLSARLVGLIIMLLLATQIIGGALFFLAMPPPRGLTVHVSEIAEALATATTTVRPEGQSGRSTENRQHRLEPILARHLATQPDRVRLWISRHPGPAPDLFDATTIDPILVGEYRAEWQRDDGTVRSVSSPQARAGVFHAMGTWLAISLACIAPVAILIGHRLTAPLSAFSRAAERLGRDPLAPPMRVAGPAEVVLAITAFNAMQDRLRAYIEDRVRMVGAIAHDMRTPLTRLRLQIEAETPESRGRAEAEIDQMERMIDGALAFVRDASLVVDRRPLHILALVQAVADDAVDAGGKVSVEPGTDPVVIGDELALRRMVRNLVDNATRYGSSARCRVVVDRDEIVLQIDDPGPGLPEGDHERAFDPFVRLGPNRDDASQGTGLGLSIVRSIVLNHGGSVTLANLPTGGLRAEVRLQGWGAITTP